MSKTERLVKRAFLGEVSSVPLQQSLRHLQKMSEPLDIRWSRPLPEGAEPSTVTVSRDAAGRWHVSLLVEATVSDAAPTASAVGIDAGITSLVALSAGEKVTNPKHRDLVVDRWYQSSTVCSACGAHHDPDGNAAPKIRGAGPAVLACEDDVRPARAQALAGSGR